MRNIKAILRLKLDCGLSHERIGQHCHDYHYAGALPRSMRQVHRAGEKLFIDYSGPTTTENRRVQVVRTTRRGRCSRPPDRCPDQGAGRLAWRDARTPGWMAERKAEQCYNVTGVTLAPRGSRPSSCRIDWIAPTFPGCRTGRKRGHLPCATVPSSATATPTPTGRAG